MIKLQIPGKRKSILVGAFVLCLVVGSCSVAEPKATANTATVNSPNTSANSETSAKAATISIDPNGPADTVRAFYKLLREKKFREAIFLTNLRPAIEGLTDVELKDFAVDFEAIAGQIPAEIEINGEIITGDRATVTANLPNEDGDKNEVQKINLSRQDGVWMIQTADEESAEKIRAEGKNYFYNLRIVTHEEEAKRMLERISKAQFAHSLQNEGAFADIQTLVIAGFLPDDIKSSESTGYNYDVEIAPDKKRYSATATPAEYKKSGVRSFILKLDAKGVSVVSGKDNGGKQLRP
ncbi:MAG: hypothetical protein WBO10_14945 [Pyrinomonadaceae bacterium]